MMTIMKRIRMTRIQRRRIPWMRSKAVALLQSPYMQIAGLGIILFSSAACRCALKWRGVPCYYTVFPLQPLAISHVCFNFSSFALFMAVTTCGLSSSASFLKILSLKRVCCVFRDIRDKNAVNQGFWSKTAVFSLPATKVHCLLIFWLPHLYNLLQPGIRKQHKYTSIH